MRWFWVVLFLVVADAALAHGPGRKLKAEVVPCRDGSASAASGLPFCLRVQNRESAPVTLTVELVAGEVMANGSPVCIPARPASGGGRAVLHAPAGERVVEYPIPSGHDADLAGSITPAPRDLACLRVRLLPATPSPDDHAGHVKPLLLFVPVGVP